MTAVEWLVEKLNSKYGNDDFIITHINEIEKAKQIEKDKAIEFAKYALEEITVIDWYNYKDFEEIYNKFNNPQNQIK